MALIDHSALRHFNDKMREHFGVEHNIFFEVRINLRKNGFDGSVFSTNSAFGPTRELFKFSKTSESELEVKNAFELGGFLHCYCRGQNKKYMSKWARVGISELLS